MLRKDKVRLEELMAPEFVLHTAHPTYPETPREMWLDNLFNHLVIDKWQQTDIFSGVAGPGEGLAAADPGLRWGGCSSGGRGCTHFPTCEVSHVRQADRKSTRLNSSH